MHGGIQVVRADIRAQREAGDPAGRVDLCVKRSFDNAVLNRIYTGVAEFAVDRCRQRADGSDKLSLPRAVDIPIAVLADIRNAVPRLSYRFSHAFLKLGAVQDIRFIRIVTDLCGLSRHKVITAGVLYSAVGVVHAQLRHDDAVPEDLIRTHDPCRHQSFLVRMDGKRR